MCNFTINFGRQHPAAHGVLRLLACLLVTLALVASPAFAQNAVQDLDKRFEEQLKKYDPKAVEAARVHFRNANIGKQLQDVVGAMVPGMSKHLKSLNPGLSDTDSSVFFEAFMQAALLDNSAFIEKWAMLNMLNVFSTEEIVYMQQVFSTEIGKKVLEKQPKMMSNFPELMDIMQRHMIPAGLAAAQAKLRAKGVEVKI